MRTVRWLHRLTPLLIVVLCFVCPLATLASSTPAVVIEPASGPCGTPIVVRGKGFAPGVGIRFILGHDRLQAVIAANSMASDLHADANGSVELQLRIADCDESEPIGSTYTLQISEWFPNAAMRFGATASARFTVTAGAMPGDLPHTGGGAMARVGDTRTAGVQWLIWLGFAFLAMLTVLRLIWYSRLSVASGKAETT